MGFLSQWDRVERVYVDDKYWIDVQACLPSDEYDRIVAAAMKENGDDSAGIGLSMLKEMIYASVVDWNLDDDEGRKFPIDPHTIRSVLRQSPAFVMNALREKVNAGNTRSTEEAKTFPDDSKRGDNGREDQAPYDSEVLAGIRIP